MSAKNAVTLLYKFCLQQITTNFDWEYVWRVEPVFFSLVSLFRKRVSTLLLTISCLAVLQCVKMCCVLFQGRRRPSCDVLPKPSMNLFYTFGRGLSLMLALTIISNFHDNCYLIELILIMPSVFLRFCNHVNFLLV